MKTILKFTGLSILFFALACSKNDNEVPEVQVAPEMEEEVKSAESELLSFVFRKADNGVPDNVIGAIQNQTVSALTTAYTDLATLLPLLEVSDGASYSPTGIQDFSEPVVYTITAEDGSEKQYTVDVKTERDLLIAIAEANPENTLEWNFAETDIDDWNGVGVDEAGYVDYLSLDEDNLSALPEEIGLFRKLEELELEGNQLSKLPASMAQLSLLNELELSNNSFSDFPEVVFELTNLIDLEYENNQLKELPDAIGKLVNLEYLYLSGNLLANLPDDVQELTTLIEMFLSENQFEEIPPVLFALSDIESLSFSGNQIKEIPANIAVFTKLRRLSVNNNLLTDLPVELAELIELDRLNVVGNPIEIIPAEICARTDIVITKDDTTICK